MQVKNLIGLRYGKLVVIEQTKSDKWGKSQWKCHCDCGNETTVSAGNLKSGGTISCGCFKKEKLRKQMTTHGDSKRRLFNIWGQMKARCNAKSLPSYKNYGGRGIAVCDEWLHDYLVFRDWALANGYSDDLSIDRKDVNGPYAPWNCRWATKKEQANNTRCNHLLCFNDRNMTLAEWADNTGINQNVIFSRLKRGWSIEHTLTTPVNASRPFVGRRIRKDSRSGINGVYQRKSGSYVAQITVNGKTIHLGDFTFISDAEKCRKCAELKYWGETL